MIYMPNISYISPYGVIGEEDFLTDLQQISLEELTGHADSLFAFFCVMSEFAQSVCSVFRAHYFLMKNRTLLSLWPG